MAPTFSLAASLLSLALILLPAQAAGSSAAPSDINHYRFARSYPANHTFSKREGWEPISVTDKADKYRLARRAEIGTESIFGDEAVLMKRDQQKNKNKKNKKHGQQNRVDEQKHHGHDGAELVTITWYEGSDLKNPSCWSNSPWSPSDESFVAAVTMLGWNEKPQCFEFIELCNQVQGGKSRCITVRIVDSCEGCDHEDDKHHVDLPKRPFSQLAPLSQGELKVYMRRIPRPNQWHKELWGPKN